MELDLSPKFSRKLFGGDGGSYHHWPSSDVPLLKEAKVGAGRLVLKPLGFALPHYADSAKVGYVLEGSGMAGLVLPQDPKEKIVRLERGDTIQVPLGGVSWWYNDGKSELTILFLGDTSSALNPGEFTYFFLTGSAGVFTGFSTEFVTKTVGTAAEQAKELFGSQPGFLIVKLQEKLPGLEPCKENVEETLTRNSLNSLFSAEAVKLDSDAVWSPRYSSKPAVQVICVIRGSGRFQIVGSSGKRVLDAEVEEGKLFVVPKFAVSSAIAGGQGIEWFSITTCPQPVYGYLTGKTSLLKAMSPQVLGASLNINQDLVKILGSKK